MANEKKDISNHIIIGMVAMTVGALGGYLLAGKGGNDLGTEGKRIKEIREIIAEKGISDFSDENGRAAMINSYLKAGGDEYAYYYNYAEDDPVADATEYVNTAPTALGSGFKIDRSDDGNIVLTEVTAGMPADKQGLKVGDVITRIDGVSVSEEGYENYASKLLGKPDTEVKLTVERDSKELEISFKRVNSEEKSVNYQKFGNIGYIQIRYFDDFMIGKLGTAFDELGGVKSVIVDLRDCPGGIVGSCTRAAAMFVESGNVVMRHFDSTEEVHDVEAGRVRADVPIVVLVNEETASAAEIMTALLKDGAKNCTIVGTQTFGKGVFQQEDELKSGGKLHYTVGEVYVNDRACYQGVGIAPDIEVPMDRSLIGTDGDIQLKKAKTLLE